MEKALYLTKENLAQKTSIWLEKLNEYSKKPQNIDLNNCALIILDIQNFFLDKTSHAFVPSAKTIIPNIKELITTFQKKDLPVIFTRYSLDETDSTNMVSWWNDTLIEGTTGTKIIPELDPESKNPKSIIIRKKYYSAFYQTELENILKQKKIKNILITGVMTHLCCDSTARDAFMRNFNIYIAVDGTASYNEDLHLSSLKALTHGFGVPISTAQLK